MGQSLTEIAQTLRDADKKMQLIYAFNGSGKTRLSREFKHNGEEISIIEENDKRVLGFLVGEVKRMYGFKSAVN